ncbi:Uncharacterized protein PECH_003762 [Penicillium ucsense]|uniref:Protein SIP5 n=1 Tax=Penicillium ucsense TaxID=2839758 RepID=A0A8J8VVT6_9EURO|nr:Uncharacterized protein PECM_003161 [Penicillium ucsense]KAF7729187.1 Uncharacterized protein PECH_003762 [Penicillium ucsense]
MGNSQTKESRSGALRQQGSSSDASGSGRNVYQATRSGRSSRPDLSVLGFGSSHREERDVATLEQRRETKQEREARRQEKETAARLKERERSMKEEHVDGGYLVTQGVYVGTEDFNKAVVRQLMIERRLAPFWRGLNDFSESWAEHQIMAAARGLPIPPPDEIPPELEYSPPKVGNSKPSGDSNIQHLTVPITSRSQSLNSDVSQNSNPNGSLPTAAPSGTSTSPFFRTRAKTLAALSSSSRHGSQTDLTPREIQLPKDPFVNGQPLEVYLYKDATECPICFLYYPPYLNRTRCCDQPICSECFVQIKRPDPHPPEHEQPNTDAPPPAEGAAPAADSGEGQLVSEPSSCPFCVQPEFGVTYAAPPFRRGLVYATDLATRPSPTVVSPVSSTTSLTSANALPIPGRRRATSLSATDPGVVTTDRVRPDWAQKLANARAHAARRSAAATALHTAAYLINATPSGSGTGNDSRGLGLSRRGLRRATHGDAGRSGSPALNALAFLGERPDRTPPRGPAAETDSTEEGQINPAATRETARRSRIDDLEEMMMMEAIRLSLASEEDRRRREEKEIRKEAKRREKEKEKEAKKAEKAARKTGLYSNNASASALGIQADPAMSKTSSASSVAEQSSSVGKGKAVDRSSPGPAAAAATTSTPSSSSSPADQSLIPPNAGSTADLSKPSHLRQVSSASSSISSLTEATPGDMNVSPTGADGGNPSLEPMFNFRSLAAVIDDDEKSQAAEHVEDAAAPGAEGSSSKALSVHHELTDAQPADPTNTDSSTIDAHDSPSEAMPKELETRSVEILQNTNREAAP